MGYSVRIASISAGALICIHLSPVPSRTAYADLMSLYDDRGSSTIDMVGPVRAFRISRLRQCPPMSVGLSIRFDTVSPGAAPLNRGFSRIPGGRPPLQGTLEYTLRIGLPSNAVWPSMPWGFSQVESKAGALPHRLESASRLLVTPVTVW